MKAPEVTTIRAGNTQRVSAQHGCRSTSRRGTASLSHWRCVSTTGPDLPQDLTESHSAQRLCHQTTVDLSFAKNKNGYVPGISQFDLDAHIARLERVFPLARERLRDATQVSTRALVLQYSTRLYHKLPHELCDILYQYFQPPPLGDVYVSVSALGDVDFAHQDHFPGCFREYEWNIGYMGKEIIEP
jgi:hypothetical protein